VYLIRHLIRPGQNIRGSAGKLFVAADACRYIRPWNRS